MSEALAVRIEEEVGKEPLSVEVSTILDKQVLEQFPVISDGELLALNAAKPVMLVEGLIEEGALTMLCGSWGTGKTALLFGIGLAVKLAQPLAGRFVARQKSRILFLGVEASPYQYSKQFRRILTGLGIESDVGIDFIATRSVDLKNEAVRFRLGRRIELGQYDLVLIDTLSAVSTANENDNTEMAEIMRWLGGQCANGRTVVFTHHTGKPNILDAKKGKFASRGASSIPANCDAEWRVELAGNAMTLTCMKGRGEVVEGDTIQLTMKWDNEKIMVSHVVEDIEKLGVHLEQSLKDVYPNGLKKADLLDRARSLQLEVSPSGLDQRVERALKKLEQTGRVSHAGQAKPYFWNPQERD